MTNGWTSYEHTEIKFWKPVGQMTAAERTEVVEHLRMIAELVEANDPIMSVTTSCHGEVTIAPPEWK